MRLASLAACVAIAVATGGCQTATDILEGKKVDYKSATSLPPLEIPPDLTTPARDNRYAVPETGKSTATLSGYQADRSQQAKTGNTTVLPNVERMRIERAGTQRWLVVQESPEKLWGVVKDFWQENGFLVQVEIAEAGVMETDWAENRAKIPHDMVRNALGKLMTFWKPDEKDRPEQYRIKVVEEAPASIVSVQDPNGAPDKTQNSEKILALLKDQLK